MELAMQVPIHSFTSQINDENCEQIIELLTNDHIIMHSSAPAKIGYNPYFDFEKIDPLSQLDNMEEKVEALVELFSNNEEQNDLLIFCPDLRAKYYDHCNSTYQGNTHASISLYDLQQNQRIFQHFANRLCIMGGEIVMNLTLHDS
jgi:hypothetical protein